MRDELRVKLLEDFPDLYPNRDPSITDYAPFQFECADGWYNIIYRLSYQLASIIANDESLAGKNVKVFQVKEKFGTMRFYMSRYTNEVHEAIAKAQEESAKTCETCGVDGDGVGLKTDGWVRTICEECEVERKGKEEERKRQWLMRRKQTEPAA
ncbi:hypothetical protein K491DRAFT_423291 [Lophiostoma macrostomum CBS 122681]|uniref:Uncharacterized protein n=1 Tax=Lophiostoma macrostomum CBS 122681 TaxID=1314788 RepID=A0A6A6T9J3_9PLEO|nr:hypothetical protein K491DRAFT_423291 [Lophiostoma macrostomum CBS 122681]